jgi:hypothetical protein
MSYVAQSGEQGSPRDHGWARWHIGACSIQRCTEPPVAAVERAAGPRRSARWQPYCEAHARSRGVERGGDDHLIWTAEFLTPTHASRDAARLRTDSTS